jgi:hypothetical protein
MLGYARIGAGVQLHGHWRANPTYIAAVLLCPRSATIAYFYQSHRSADPSAPDMTSDITDFVRRALEAKISRDDIAKALTAAKWPDHEIKSALGAFADVPFAIAVPRPRPYLSARDVFTYLVLFCALYASVFYIVQLLFSFIDKAIPDAAANSYGYAYLDSTIRWDIAGLIVSVPLFLYMFRLVSRRISRDPMARESKPRKWLTYVTLALAVSAMAGDLAGIVYNALSGDLTLPIILKSLVVALIAGGTFLYFFNDVRQGEDA